MQNDMQSEQIMTILDLKSILALVREDITMRTLTVAIRQYCIQQQVTQLRDQILRFFLRCETKLKRQTNQEWNRVVHAELKKIVAIQKLNSFMTCKFWQSGWNCILKMSFMCEQSRVQETINEEFGELRDMEISEDVRVKTKYFFIWTQFLNEKREIKRLKNKEIEDLKKAKTFSQYTAKFHSFMGWKQYVKKMKTIKEKAVLLENKTKAKQLTTVVAEMKQKIEIIEIEKMLEETVSKRLEVLNITSVFHKLQKGKEKSQLYGDHLNKKNNIWLYRFYVYLTKNCEALMNKTSVRSREVLVQEYRHACLTTSWKGLKNLMKITMSKINQIKWTLKAANLREFVKIRKSMTSIGENIKNTRELSKKSHFNLLIKSIKHEGDKQTDFLDCDKKVKQLLTTSSSTFLLKQLQRLRNHRTQIKNKLVKYCQNSTVIVKRHFFTNLRSFNSKTLAIRTQARKVRCVYLMQLLKFQTSSYKEWKKQCEDVKTELSGQHQKFLLKQTWRGLKNIKQLKAGEEQALSILVQIMQSKILSETFLYLKTRHNTSINLQKLVKKAEFVVTKVSFITILNRMLSKKMKIRSFTSKQELQVKKKLFDLLIANSELMQISQQRTQKVYARIMKRTLLNRLKDELQIKYFQTDVQAMLQERSKKTLFIKMREYHKKKNEYEEREEKACGLIKKIRLGHFVGSIQMFIDHRQEEEGKSMKLAKKIVRNYVKSFRKNVRGCQERRQINKELEISYRQSTNKVQMMLASNSLQKIIRQNESVVYRKYQELKKLKVKQLIKLLQCNQKSLALKKELASSRAFDSIKHLKEYSSIKTKNDRLSSCLLKNKLHFSLRTMSQHISYDAIELKEKANAFKEVVMNIRQKKSKEDLIYKLKSHFELKQNFMILLNHRVRSNYRELIRMNLSQKSRGLKEFMALRYHATNIKRRAMRALKCTMTISLLKENKTRTDNSSKILMQKSIDNVRKKSKLIETIERYNLSRVSRVIR